MGVLFPFFYAFFVFLRIFPLFLRIFPLFLRFSLLLLIKDKGKQRQFTAKMGNFTPTPSAPTPCYTVQVYVRFSILRFGHLRSERTAQRAMRETF